MTARTRTAALAAVGSLGLVSLAYGVGGAVGGGSASAVGASTTTTPQQQQQQGRGFNEDPAHEQGEGAAREAAEDNGTARHGPCRHHDGSGSSSDSSTQTAPDPNSY